MSQQIMCWKSAPGSEEKILHIWHQGGWKPYFSTPYHVPDYRSISGTSHSKGWATYQALHKQGWKIVSEQVKPQPKECPPLMPMSEQQDFAEYSRRVG